MQWLVLIHGLTAVIGIFSGHFPVQKKQSVGDLKQSVGDSKQLVKLSGCLDLYPIIGGQ
jgi:hypothetical protein